MNKRFYISLLLMFVALTVSAQRITGTVVDKDTKDAVMQATVSLLKQDSTFVKGVISDTSGKFSVTAPKNGAYILKITSVSYKTFFKKLDVKGDLALGNVNIAADAIMLKEAVVTGQAAKVVVKEDTFVYNAAAYQTPEGSVIEELVKRLPGAQVDDDGKITINGKQVKKIKVDGKEFMTGDTETALKNLPTSIIDRIKAYDEKSDLSRVTGIDDGNEETVLDFGIKRGMNKGFMSNVDLAIGTKDRYSNRGMFSFMKDNLRVMSFLSANNVGDRGFGGGRGGWGGGSNGLSASKMVGLNLNYEIQKLLKLDGSVRWNHRDNDTWSKTASESYIGTTSSFSNKLSQAYGRNNSWNAQMRVEWTPDTMTNIMFRPSISYSTRDNKSNGHSVTFNQDPYIYVLNPLDTEDLKKLMEKDIVVNDQESNSLSYNKSNSVNGMLQYNRKLGNRGRNLTLRADASYSEGESQSSSMQNVLLALQDSTYSTIRYNTTPTKNYEYTLRATYSEPLMKTLFLQLSYNFKYSKQKSDRATYRYDNMPQFNGWVPVYRDWQDFLGRVTNPLGPDYYDNNLSKYSEYDNYTHEAEVTLRKHGEKYNFSAGVMFQPQTSDFKYKYQGLDTIVKRSVFNFSPSVDFRYRFNKVSQLRMNYRGSTSQPSMTDMLDITDDSNPLNITKGNPGLKPSFTQNMNIRYNTYIQSHMQSIMANLNFSTTRNSISSMVTYNEATGGRTTRPENINGNWNIRGAFMYNTSIDSAGVWNINTFSNVNYQNHASYLYDNTLKQSLTNTTRSTTLMERLSMSYRSQWLEVEPNGFVSYMHTRNLLQSSSDADTYSFNYGININIKAPWGTQFATDWHMNSRRGYSDSNLNTNESVWNAQISQSFLKARSLTLTLQFYDILQNQSNFSRTINAMGRTDTENNIINSYAMLHVIYRFNSFGGKAARQGMGEGPGPDFSRPEFRRGAGGNGGGGFPGGGGFGGRRGF